MKLRVRVNRLTRRVELEGPQPTLTQLSTRVTDDVLPSAGISTDTEFTLSLNGTEPLVDTGQTLSSCGVVSGDMISVILPQSSSSSAQSCEGADDRRREAAVDVQKDAGGASTSSAERAEDPDMEAMQGGEEEEEEEEEVMGLFIPEPMLLCEAEDGTVPHSLETLYQNAQCQSKDDCAVLAAHVLMLETGFQLQGSNGRRADMPTGWRPAKGLYRLQYTHPLCEDIPAHMVLVKMEELLVVHGALKTSGTPKNTIKVDLKTDAYVSDEWPGGNPSVTYRDLPKLSRLFKDQLAYPLIATAREVLGLPALFGLSTLPPELLLRILRLLDVRAVLTLSAVCRYLYTVAQDSSLWKHLLQRDFRSINTSHLAGIQTDTNHSGSAWKELYKDRYQRRKLLCRPCIRPYHRIIPMPMTPYPRPFFPPGIIGGEDDETLGIPPGIFPRPRYDPISPLGDPDPGRRFPRDRRSRRWEGNRAMDVRRGFI